MLRITLFFCGNFTGCDGGRLERPRCFLYGEKLRKLVDTTNSPFFGIDFHGNVNEWNNKTSEINGFNRDEEWCKSLLDTFIVPSI